MKRTTVKAPTVPKPTKAASALRVAKPRATKAPARAATMLTDAEIAARAYEIFAARKGAPGDPVSDWLQAERELRAEL